MLLKSFLHVLVFEEKFEPIESTERMYKMFKKKALSANRGPTGSYQGLGALFNDITTYPFLG